MIEETLPAGDHSLRISGPVFLSARGEETRGDASPSRCSGLRLLHLSSHIVARERASYLPGAVPSTPATASIGDGVGATTPRARFVVPPFGGAGDARPESHDPLYPPRFTTFPASLRTDLRLPVEPARSAPGTAAVARLPVSV